jgi:hypothetical protein
MPIERCDEMDGDEILEDCFDEYIERMVKEHEPWY